MNRKQLKKKLNRARHHVGHSHRQLTKPLESFKNKVGLQVLIPKSSAPNGYSHEKKKILGRVYKSIDLDSVMVYSSGFDMCGHIGDEPYGSHNENYWWVSGRDLEVVNV